MAIPAIDEWAESRFGYYTDRRWEGGRWRKEKAPIRLADHHKRILAHAFRLRDDGTLSYDTIAWCESAKSGKTTLNALIHEWFALHVDAPAEQFVVANKQDQAMSRAYRALCQSVAWNPHLRVDSNPVSVACHANCAPRRPSDAARRFASPSVWWRYISRCRAMRGCVNA